MLYMKGFTIFLFFGVVDLEKVRDRTHEVQLILPVLCFSIIQFIFYLHLPVFPFDICPGDKGDKDQHAAES